VHFTPTHASWMSMVEVWFSIAQRQAIRRGSYRSVRELTTAIRGFIDGWNDRAHPFIWTETRRCGPGQSRSADDTAQVVVRQEHGTGVSPVAWDRAGPG
jgi:hypothetical protein